MSAGLCVVLILTLFLLPLQPARAFPSGITDNAVEIRVSMHVNRDIYLQTNYGDPPQLAVWKECVNTGQIKTIWVANRAGRRWWTGKVECLVALPFWESRHQHESGDYKKRGLLKRLIDAITGATPTGGIFTVSSQAENGGVWDVFIEVNVSADFNAAFPYWRSDGFPDHEGNGQPSLVYKARIEASPGLSVKPELAGRTDHWEPVDTLITDLSGITTAKKVLSDLRIDILEK